MIGRRRARGITWLAQACAWAGLGCAVSSTWSPLDLSGSSVVVLPANVAAGAGGTATARVVLRAADGTPWHWDGLRVAVVAPGCTVGPAAEVGADGAAAVAVGPCVAGVRLVRATLRDGSLAVPLAASASLNAYAPAAATAEALQVGARLDLAVDAGDGYVGTVTFVSSDPLASLPSDVLLTAAAHGVLSLGQQAVLRTPGTQTLTALDRATGRVLAEQTFVVAPPAGDDEGPASALLVLAPASAVAGVPLTVSVAALDADGDVTGAATGALALTADDPDATLPAPVAPLAGAGPRTAVLPGTVLRRAGVTTLTVRSAAGLVGRAQVVVVPGAEAHVWLRLAAGQGSGPWVAGSGPVLETGGTDAFGNALPDLSGDLVLSSSDPAAELPHGLLAGAAGAASGGAASAGGGAGIGPGESAAAFGRLAPAPGGVGPRRFAVRFATAGSQTVTATAASGRTAQLGAQAVVAGPLAQLVLAVPSATVATPVAGLTVAPADAYGNVVPGYSGTVALTADDPAAVLPAPVALAAATPLPAVFPGTATFGRPGPVTVRATATPQVGGLPVPAVVVVPVAASPAEAAQATLTRTAGLPAADGRDATTVTLAVVDGQGHPSPFQAVQWSATAGLALCVLPPGQPTGCADAARPALTDAQGTLAVAVRSRHAGSGTVAAAVAGLLRTTAVAFAAGPAAPATSTLGATPAGQRADGVAATALTATFRDVDGNPVAGAPVTFRTSNGADAVTPAVATTDADGIATATLRSTVAGLRTASAQSGSAVLAAPVRLMPGPAAAATSLLAVAPRVLPADGSPSGAVVLLVADAAGNPLPGLPAALSVGRATSQLSTTAATTDAQGLVATTLRGVAVGAEAVQAVVGGLTLTAPVTFVAGAADPAQSTVTVLPAAVPADGDSAATLTLVARDAQGRAATGQAVTVNSPAPEVCVVAAAAVTDAAGRFLAALRSRKAGTKTVVVGVGDAQIGTQVTFTAGLPVAAGSSLTLGPAQVRADGSALLSLRVALVDAFGNPAAGVPVALASSGSHNLLQPIAPVSGTTDARGVLLAAMTSTRAEPKLITASAVGALLSGTALFVPGPVSAATTSLGASPATALADGASPIALRLAVADLRGNPIAGAAASFGASGGAVTFAPTSGMTDPQGVLTATVTATAPGPRTLTALVGGMTATAHVAFAAAVSGTADAAHSALTLAPATPVPADGAGAVSITLHLADSAGVALAGRSVTLTSTGTGNALALLYPVDGRTDAAGNLQARLTSTVAEAKTLTASAAGVTLTGTAQFVAGAPTSGSSSFLASPTTVVADGGTAATLTATVRDAQGNPAAGVPVSFSRAGLAATLGAATATTGSDGTATTTLVCAQAGTATVTAAFAGTSRSAQVIFVAGSADAATSALAVTPASLIADGSAQASLTVHLRDPLGNGVPGQAVALTASGSGNVLAPSTGVTDAQGDFVATLRATVAEAKAVSASVAGLTLPASVTFVPGLPATGTSTWSATPATLVADGSAAAALQLVVRDLRGNPVPGVAVGFAVDGTGATVLPAAGTTAADGSVAAALSGTVAGTRTATASFAGTGLTTTVTLVPGPPVPAQSTLTVTPVNPVADGTSAATVALTLQDAQGNPVPGAAVMLGVTGSNATLTPASGTTDGTGSLSAQLTSTRAEAKTVTATFPGGSLTALLTFDPGPPASSTSDLVAAPDNQPADGTTTTALTLHVRDLHGNAVGGEAVGFTAGGGQNTLTPANATTAADGSAGATLASTQAETKALTAFFAGTSVGTQVTFVSSGASAVGSQLAASRTSLVADGSATTTLTITVRDGSNNPVAGESVTFSSSGSGNAFGATSATTASDGTAQVTLASTRAETKTVTASTSGGPVTATVAFVAGPVSVPQSTFTATPGTATADGGATVALALVARDAQGNPVPGAAVTLAASGTGNLLAPATGTTDAAGSLTATLASTVAAAKAVTATVGGATLTTSATFTAGGASGTTSVLQASPSTVVADGSAAATLTLRVRDAAGNPVSGVAVSLSAAGSGNALTPASGTTSAAGTLSASLTSTAAAAKLVTASFAGQTATATVTFVPGPPAATASSFTASPATVAADNAATAALLATIRDVQGNAVPGVSVTFSSSGSGNALSPTTATTAADGTATATLASTRAESKAVTAAFAAQQLGTSVTFAATSVAAGQSSFAAAPTTLAADNAATATLTVRAADAHANGVPGQAVTLSGAQAGDTLSPASGTTDAAGSFVATLRGIAAGSRALSATVGGVTLPASATLVAGPPVSSTSHLTASPASATADGSSAVALSVLLADAQGNPVPGVAVSLAQSGTAQLTPNAGTTSAAGTMSATLTATAAQALTVTASFAGTSVSAPATFVAGAPAQATSAVAAAPSTLTADGVATTTLTATVHDAQGNPVAGQTVSFSASGIGHVLSGATATTSPAGTATVTLQGTVAGTKTVTASFAGKTVTTTVTLVPGPVAQATSQLTVTPASVVADNAAQATLTARFADAQNNPVPGVAVAFTAAGGSYVLTPAGASTDATGTLTATLTSSVAGPRGVTATAAGVTVPATAQFVAGAATAAQSSFTATGGPLVADGSTVATLTVHLADAQGNAVPGAAVSLATTGSGNTLTPASGATDATGTFAATLTTTVAQAKSLTATFAGGPLATTATFAPGPPTSATSTLVASPASVTADGTATATLTATLRDAQGNLVPGVTVGFAAGGTGNSLGAASATSGADGTAAVALASTVAEAKTVTASFAGTQITAPVSFVPGGVAAGTSSLAAAPASVVADGSATAAVNARARDARGNPVPGAAVTLSSSGTGNTFAAASGSTDGTGTFATTLRATVAEAKSLSATVGGVPLAAGVTFVAGPPATTTSSVTVVPSSVAADGTSTAALTAHVRDATNNPVAGAAVSFTSTGASNTFTPASGATAADGTLTATLASIVAQVKTVTAAFGGTSASGSVTFVPTGAVVANSAVAASPVTVVADNAAITTLTATLRDGQGNAVPGAAVTFAVSGSSNTLSGTSATTDAAGTAAVTLRSARAEAKTVTATFAAGSVTTPVTFVAGDVAQATSTFAAAPGSVVADGAATTTLTATARDAQGNPVAGQTVAFASSGTGNTLTPASATTNAAGIATATLASTVAGARSLTATVAGATLTASSTFTPGGPTAGNSSVVASPGTVTANGTSTMALTVRLRDAQGNAVPGVAVTLSASGSNNVLTPGSGTTDATGTLVATLASQTAESKLITAAFASTQVTTTASFVAGIAASQTSQVVASPASVAADGTTATTLTATVRDAQGNAVPGQTVTFAAGGSGNTLSATTATASAAGTAAVTLKSTVAEQKAITASFASTSVGTQVTFVPGPAFAANSSLAASPATRVADGTATVALTVLVRDAQGNPRAGDAVTLSSTGSGHTLTPASGSTGANGTLTASMVSTVAQAKTLTATVAGLTLNAGVTFVPGPAVSATSTVTAVPTTTVADGSSGVALTVQVRDAQGNAVPGQAVTLAATGSGNALSPSSGTTAADGTLAATLTSTAPGAKTVTATFAGTAASTTVTFVAGSQSTSSSQVVASPASVVADGSHVATLTATIRDGQGNPLAGQSVTFSSSGSGNTLSAATATTAADGTASVTLSSTLAEAKTISATTTAGTVTTAVTFVPGPVVAGTSSVSASPTSPTADGSSTTTVTVLARDANGNPVPGQAVTLTPGGTGNTLSAASGTTGAGGTFTATLSSTVAEAKALSATVAGVGLSGSVTFVPGAAVAGTSTVVAAPATTVADGSTTTAVTATVRDARGNVVPGVAVTLAAAGTGNTLTPTSGTTSAAGTVTAALASTVAEAKTLTVTFGALQATGTTTFVAGPAASSTSTLSAAPASVAADGTATTTLTATLRDARGNLVAGQGVTFASSGTGNTLSATTGTTSAGGTAAVTLASTVAEVKTVSVNFAGTAVTAAVTFVPGAVTAGTSSVTASPASVVADGTTATSVTVLARDARGNPVPGQAVTLSSTGTGHTFTPASGTTDAGGSLVVQLTSTVAQAKTVTATIAGVPVTGSVTFVPGSPASGTSSLAAVPATVTANGTATAALTVTVADARGNPVPGVAVTLASSGSNNVLTPASGTTNAAGQMTATLASTVAGARTVTASFAGTAVTATVTFAPGAAAQGTSQVVAGPASVTADGVATTALTATIRDAQGNPVPGQAVTFSSTGSANTFSSTSATTAADGTASVTLASTKAEAKTVTAAFASTSVTAPVTFVPGPVSSSTSSVSAAPGSLTADGSTTTAVTVLLRDAQSNPIAGQPLTLAAGGTGNTLSATSGTTGAGGTVTATLKSTVAEAKALTASAAGVALSGSVTFVPGAAAQGTSSVTASPSSLIANGTTATTVTALVRDAQGNPVPGVTVTLSASGTGQAFTPASGTTDAAGSLQASMTSTVAEAKTLTAAFASTSVTGPVTFVSGPAVASTSTFTASPASVTANGVATTTLTATVRDAQSNPIAGQSVTFASSGTGNTLSAASATTSASGVAQVTLASTKAEAKALTVTFAGITLSAGATFVPGAPLAANTSVTATPASLTADGTTTTSVTLLVADAQGNPAPGLAVTLASTGSGNTWSSTSGTTGAAGTFTATLKSTVAQTKTLTGTATASGVSATLPVTFVSGPPTSQASTLTPSAPTATADGSTTVTLTLAVADAQGNAVAGQAVTFAATGSGNTLSSTTGTTSGAGSVAITLRSTVAEAKTVTASFAGTQLTAQVSFVPGVPAAGTSSLVASPTSLTANGSSQTTLTATVRDAQGNLAPGQTVTFSSSGSANTFSTTTATTSAAGTAAVTLASTKAEVKTATASFASTSVNAAVTFVAGAPTAGQSSVTPSPTSVTANGTATTTVTVLVADAQGNPVSGQAVALAVSGSGNTLSAVGGTTSAAGTWSTTLASTKAEAKVLTASFAGLNVTGNATFVAGPMATGTSVLTATPSLLTADNTATSTLSLTALDAQGNPLTGQTASFTVGGSSNTLSAATATTSGAGVATITVRSSQAEQKAVSVTVGAVTKVGSVTFGRGSTARSQLTASPASLAADGSTTTTLTAIIRDPNNVLLGGVPVTMASTRTNNVFTPGSGTTDAAGKFVTTLKTTYAGARTITATAGSAAPSVGVTFTVPVCSATTPTFGGPPVIASSSATGVTVGDLNNDGKNDLCVARWDASAVDILLGHGNGAFTSAQTLALNLPIMGCALADLNRDGYADIVAHCYTGTTTSFVTLMNNGAGTGWAVTPYASPVVSGLNGTMYDFNGDGYLDFALAALGTNAVYVFLGTSSGGFGTGTAATLAPGAAVVDLRPNPDVNGDGKPDILVSENSGPSVVFLPGKGDGTFGTAIATTAAPALQYGYMPMTTYDYNGDGKVDVAISANGGGGVNVLDGRGDGTFQPYRTVVAGAWNANSLGTVDVTGDGIADLLLTDWTTTVLALAGRGDGTFTRAAQTQVALLGVGGLGRYAGAYGDIDGDGRTDVLISTRSGGYAGLLMGGGSAWQAPQNFAVPAGAQFGIAMVALQDFDQDGNVDVLAAQQSAGHYFFRGDGSGGFATPVAVAGTAASWGIAAADLNGDGKADLVAGSGTVAAFVQVSLGKGDGTFAPAVTYATAGKVLAPSIADLNGDGKVDVVAPIWTDAKAVAILLGQGDGTFAAANNYVTDGNNTMVDVADFNGDGRPDLAMPAGGSSGGTVVDVLLGTGGGAFGAATAYTVGAFPYSVRAVDLDGDGKVDLVVSSSGAGTVSVLRGNGNGTFQAASTIDAACPNAALISVADINGDGKLDVVVPSQGAPNTVHVIAGHGDGTFGLPAAYLALTTGYPTHAAVGDLNGDGRPDLVVTGSGVSPGAFVVLQSGACLP